MNKNELYILLYELIENSDKNIQFKMRLNSLFSDVNVRFLIQYTRYSFPPHNIKNLPKLIKYDVLNLSSDYSCDILIGLIRDCFNDKYIILCNEIFSRHLLRTNESDSRGLGIFDNGILYGYDIDLLLTLPCMKQTDAEYFNKMLLVSYLKNHNNVLTYMIKRCVKIKNHWNILRIMIIKYTLENKPEILEDINTLLQHYSIDVRDNYGNTPIMIAKFLRNKKLINMFINNYKPNLNLTNKHYATYYNIKQSNCVLTKKYVSNIKKYDELVSNILPSNTIKQTLLTIVILIFMFLNHLI